MISFIKCFRRLKEEKCDTPVSSSSYDKDVGDLTFEEVKYELNNIDNDSKQKGFSIYRNRKLEDRKRMLNYRVRYRMILGNLEKKDLGFYTRPIKSMPFNDVLNELHYIRDDIIDGGTFNGVNLETRLRELERCLLEHC